METNKPDIHEILRIYWRYGQFRPLQQDIIEYVLQGKDALALLPTGGGKSVCFQVPAMAMRGVCIVISPLIALMRDQVENLEKRGIPAGAVYSGMSARETELVLNAAVHQRLKFLYVSPERCRNAMFLAHLQRMQVCLLAVDEAHCVAQWGYDFRPPYLQIAELRSFLPGVPLLALTATATPDVVDDIQEKLAISPRKVFQKSFRRENLIYYVVYDEDKLGRLERVIRKTGGSGIVYVRSRKKTADIAGILRQRGISATFYHGGLDAGERAERQQAWIENRVQVMVATNAFGMGIDKPDVRYVVHLDLPDTIEAYFQEAGRAGRDERRAFAVLIYHPSDRLEAKENLAKAYPSVSFIRRVYEAAGNYFHLPPGCGEGESFAFDLKEFARIYDFPLAETASALSFLEKEGYLRLSDAAHETAKVRFLSDYETVYRYEVAHPSMEPVLKMLLRNYGGRLYSDYVPVYEQDLARQLHTTETQVRKWLGQLASVSLLDYRPRPTGSLLTFVMERRASGPYFLRPEVYSQRKEIAIRKSDAVLGYVQGRILCRNRYLLQYFGEHATCDCGLCDVCIEKKQRNKTPEIDRPDLLERVEKLMRERAVTLRELADLWPDEPEEDLKRLWQYLQEEGSILPEGLIRFRWREK